MAEWVGNRSFKGPFQSLNKFYDSVIPREAGTEVLEQRYASEGKRLCPGSITR